MIPSTIDGISDNGCCRLRLEDGFGNTSSVTVGSKLTGVTATRPQLPQLFPETITGVIPNSEVCATIAVGCCGGTIRADFIHALAGRNLEGGVEIIPQLQLNGGGWLNMFSTGPDELVLVSGGGNTPSQYDGEREFTDTQFINVAGPASHTICVRLFMRRSVEFGFTGGSVHPMQAALHLQSVETECC